MNALKNYIVESYIELSKKVTWPTFAELQKSAIVVLIASMIIAFVLLAMDLFSNKVLDFYYAM